MNDRTAEGVEKPSKGPSVLLVVPATMLLTLALAAGGYFLLGGEKSAKAAEKPVEAKPAAYAQDLNKVLELAPFVVSLQNDGPSQRAPRLRFIAVVEGIDAKATPAEIFRLRNEVLLAVHDVEVDVLQSPEGIDALRTAILDRAKEKLGMPLYSVLITDYVVL